MDNIGGATADQPNTYSVPKSKTAVTDPPNPAGLDAHGCVKIETTVHTPTK